ncbi:hypothetical protein SAMN05518871_109119 [Psychrobacillus sp. OK028]|nr:hypothetical protein SAMN05518871_109119 [Psychrobacillus sp. OK028]
MVLGNVLRNEECDELIRLSKDKIKRSKIGTTREVNELRRSSSMFWEESENEVAVIVEKRVKQRFKWKCFSIQLHLKNEVHQLANIIVASHKWNDY